MRLRFASILASLLLACSVAAEAQPSSMTRYWEVVPFASFPAMGPQAALGLLIWSHSRATPNQEPPPIILEFAKSGWDVAKVQRNPLFDGAWGDKGERHVEDILQRVKKARADGYKYVLLAGQEHGGTISLEAAGRTDQVFGVLAFAPRHGGYGCGPQSPTRIAEPHLLPPAITKVKAPRMVVSMAAGDECQVGYSSPTPGIEGALQASAAKYIHFDDKMPIRGHAAAETEQFSTWYRDCLIGFMTPGREPTAKKTTCPVPANTRFLIPANVKLDAPAGKGSAVVDMTGPWLGAAAANAPGNADVCVVVDKVAADEASGTAYFGAGPNSAYNMSAIAFRARKDGANYIYRGPDLYSITLTPREAGLGLTIVSRNGRNTVTHQLRRGCVG